MKKTHSQQPLIECPLWARCWSRCCRYKESWRSWSLPSWHVSTGDNKLAISCTRDYYSAGWRRRAFVRGSEHMNNRKQCQEVGGCICLELRPLKVKGPEKSLSWNSIDNRHLATHTGACLTVGEEKFYVSPSRFCSWSNNQINIKQINRRKTNLIRYVQGPHKNET